MKDLPEHWRPTKITVEVQAKAKEVAVEKLMTELKNGESAEKWFVYLVRCADDTLYTGITNDLDRRLEKHNAGTASRYTRSRLPVELVYQEEQANRSLALKRELAIKKLSRRQKHLLINTVESDPKSPNQRENIMAKIPSSKFSTAKKKIASAKFPTAKRKLSSSKPASQSAKIPSRKFPKAKKVTKKVVNEPAPLGHPKDEQARQDAVAILKSRTDALKAVKGKKAELNLKYPLPRTPAQWLKEIKLAIVDAAEAAPFGPMVGTEITPANLFHLAPVVCLKFRGKKQQGREAKRVIEVALANYIVNSDPKGIDHGLEQRPMMGFILCYVAAHLALDLLDEQQAEAILIYCEEHLEAE